MQNQLRRSDLEARWFQNIRVNRYGYKNNNCIDVEHGLIRRYAVTSANIHNKQILPIRLDPEDTEDYVWADSVYFGEFSEDLLSLEGFESCIHKKGRRFVRLAKLRKNVNELN